MAAANRATVIATLPPPTTGMTRVTERMVAELSSEGSLTVVNLSEGGAFRRRAWKLVRSGRQARAAARVLAGRLGEGSIYLALNSGPAVALDILLVAAARARRRRVFLHHHSFRFIDSPSPILRALYRIGGKGVIDIALCDGMAEGLRRAYGRTDTCVVPNLVEPTSLSSSPPHRGAVLPPSPQVWGEGGPEGLGGSPVKLGHLANLTIDKGVARAIDAFAAARARGLDVELHIAGPFASAEARTAVETAQTRWPGALVYHGPVYGADKTAFYAGLDLFLYPTAYAVEAQPLVLLEALAAGVPILSAERGCIGGLADSAVGDAVSICGLDTFPDTTCALIQQIASRDQEGRASAHTNAVATAEALAEEARSAFAAIATEIFICAGSSASRSSSWQSSSSPTAGGG